MAGLQFNSTSDEVALVAATAKTVWQGKAPANQRLIIRAVKFLGVMPAGGVDVPVKIRLTRNSANFGTGSAAATGKHNPSNPETLQGTYSKNFTVEPTTPADGGLQWDVNPQSGIIESLPLDQWIEIPGGQSAQFEITAPATSKIVITVSGDE